VEDAKSGENPADPGSIEQTRGGQRKPRHQQAPRLRPRQHDEHQAGVHEIAHIENDEKKAAQLHLAIISRTPNRTQEGSKIPNSEFRIPNSTLRPMLICCHENPLGFAAATDAFGGE